MQPAQFQSWPTQAYGLALAHVNGIGIATCANGCCHTTPLPAPLPLCATPPVALRHRPHCARSLRWVPSPCASWVPVQVRGQCMMLVHCGQCASCTPLVAFHAAPDPSSGPALTPASLRVISFGPCAPCRIPHNDNPDRHSQHCHTQAKPH